MANYGIPYPSRLLADPYIWYHASGCLNLFLEKSWWMGFRTSSYVT